MPRSKGMRHRLLDRHRALLPADRLHRLRAAALAAGGGGVHSPRLPRVLPGGALVGQVPRRRRCCSRRCRRGSRSGPTPASPSRSARRSSPTSRWATARRRGAGRRAPACSGRSRTSSGAACRNRKARGKRDLRFVFADQAGPLVPSLAQHEIESQGARPCDARFVGMSLAPGQTGGRPGSDRAGCGRQ